MKGCARVSVRVDPAGGGTDAPPYCLDHGGAVVNFAVQRHAFAMAQRLDAGKGVTLYAMDINQGKTVASVAQLSESSDLEFLGAFVMRLVPTGDSVLLVTEKPTCQPAAGWAAAEPWAWRSSRRSIGFMASNVHPRIRPLWPTKSSAKISAIPAAIKTRMARRSAASTI